MNASESNADNHGTELNARRDEGFELAHATVENDDGETEYTIFPRECEEAEIVTRWITVTEESLVSLEAMR